MDDRPAVYVLLTTYHTKDRPRTEIALRTVRGILQNLHYSNYGFYISDDGTEDPQHVNSLVNEIGSFVPYYVYNGQRRGVGHGMNYCMQHLFSMGIQHLLLLEDDWELNKPLNLLPYVNLLTNSEDIGMIRMGYMSTGLSGEIISREDRLWWNLHRGYQYTYAGHANLRHKRFHDSLGLFEEGLAPGANELNMCGRYNTAPSVPAIVWPAEYGQWGIFDHIGGVSLADIQPGT